MAAKSIRHFLVTSSDPFFACLGVGLGLFDALHFASSFSAVHVSFSLHSLKHFLQSCLTQAAVLFVPQSVSFLQACPSHAARLNAFEHVNPLGQTGHFWQIIVGVPSSLPCKAVHIQTSPSLHFLLHAMQRRSANFPVFAHTSPFFEHGLRGLHSTGAPVVFVVVVEVASVSARRSARVTIAVKKFIL